MSALDVAVPLAPAEKLDQAVATFSAAMGGAARLEVLVRLALEAIAGAGELTSSTGQARVERHLRERMAQAAAAWELEAPSATLAAVDAALERATKAEAENARLREVLVDKQAFLEASVAKHIHEMGQQRDTVDALAREVLWRGGKR